MDILDRQYVQDRLDSWIGGNLLQQSGAAAVLFLVLALAAQMRSSGAVDAQRAQHYYQQGRRIALLKLTGEPQLETVQAFTLISLYMLGCSQRNGSFLNLGIAISAAKALGFHRDDLNTVSAEGSSSNLR